MQKGSPPEPLDFFIWTVEVRFTGRFGMVTVSCGAMACCELLGADAVCDSLVGFSYGDLRPLYGDVVFQVRGGW